MNYQEILNYSMGLSVLFVEDDMNFRNETYEVLNLLFHKVDVATNGVEGLEKYKEFYLDNDCYYDLVITDVSMPLMNGEELIKEIKIINDSQFIVVVSAHTENDTLISFIKLGIKDLLSKPISTEGLYKCILNVSKKISTDKNQINYLENGVTNDSNVHKLLYADSDEYMDIYR